MFPDSDHFCMFSQAWTTAVCTGRAPSGSAEFSLIVVNYNRLKPSKASNGNANHHSRQPRQSAQLDNNTPNLDPEFNNTADIPACVNDSNLQSVLMLPPRPIINLADDIDSDLTDEGQDESSEREDAELHEQAHADDTMIDAGAQIDLNDKDWEPPQTVRVRAVSYTHLDVYKRQIL